MKTTSFLLIAALAAAPFVPAQAQMVNHNTVHAEAHEMMSRALTDAIEAIDASDGGTIRIPRFICPHAMMALAALGSGAVGVEGGTVLFMQGLAQDEADMMKAQIGRGPAMDFAKGTGVAIEFELARGITPDTLIGIAKEGLAAMR